MKPTISFAALCLVLASLSHAAVTLTLNPLGGAISGPAGSTVGWGFTLSNPSDFAVITSSNFCLGSSGISNQCAASTLGAYTDYIASNFTIAGPQPESSVVTEAFSAAGMKGVGSFAISANAPANTMSIGQLVATYDLYSLDPLAPNFDPIADLISNGNFLAASASITVNPSTTLTPEPSCAALFVLGGLLIVSPGLLCRIPAFLDRSNRKGENSCR